MRNKVPLAAGVMLKQEELAFTRLFNLLSFLQTSSDS